MTQNSSDPADIQIDPLSRRNFMKWSGGCASLTSTAIMSQLLNLHLTESAIAAENPGDDYKALVCVFLLGGVDSFNMVTPYESSTAADGGEYGRYETIRANLALPKEVDGEEYLLPFPVDMDNASGRKLAFHPGMAEVKTLYEQKNAAIIANVGSLIYPVTKPQFNQKSVQLPLGLFSHSDLQQHWQTSFPQSRTQVTGWGGRMADLLAANYNVPNTAAVPRVSMNISVNGLNLFQTGASTVPYSVGTNGATLLGGYDGTAPRDRIYQQLTNNLYPSDTGDPLTQRYSDLLQRTLAGNKRVSIDSAQAFSDATSSVGISTPFPNTGLAKQLKMVARTIAGRSALGQNRQIFFVAAGGWDHHDEVLNAQERQLPQVSQALSAFYQATDELGVADRVTSFTASDFGRTLTSNGNGSDHAWGGNHIVMGGAVQGGKVYGDYPMDLAAGNDLDADRGRLIPTTSVDEYNAELARWFGVSPTLMPDILPNIGNFAGRQSLDFLS